MHQHISLQERIEKCNALAHIHTYSLTHALSLARTNKHTHTYCIHTHRHVHFHTHPRSGSASLHERTEILTSHLKTKHATYADMYTCRRPQRTSTSLQKGQKRVTDKHTYNIRARSLARTHKHTHTHIVHTHTHTRIHSYASSKQKRFTSRKNSNFNLTPENKTCHIRRHVHTPSMH